MLVTVSGVVGLIPVAVAGDTLIRGTIGLGADEDASVARPPLRTAISPTTTANTTINAADATYGIQRPIPRMLRSINLLTFASKPGDATLGGDLGR
jgi:hypothetical protein